jgi:hypothetical protein
VDFRGYYASNTGEAQVKVKVKVQTKICQPTIPFRNPFLTADDADVADAAAEAGAEAG